MNITEALKTRRIFFDGAMGSMIDPADIPEGNIPESMLLVCPGKIEKIHRAYIDAGADVIITATFGANRAKLSKYGMTVKEIYDAGVKCARKACEGAGREIWIAGDIGPLGRLLSPIGDLPFEDAYDMFYEMAKCAEEAGADFLLIETMNDAYELRAAVLAAKEASSLPIAATVVVDENGKLLTGAPIEAVGALLEGLGADVCGINCGFGPDKAVEAVKRLYYSCSLPIVSEPNAGLPRATASGGAVYDMDAETYADWQVKIAPYTHAQGGCCGTTPDYIRILRERCGSIPVPAEREFTKTVVTSGMEAVEIGPDHPVIIGERINPTGKKLLKEALRSGDIGYILNEGIRQQENGAHILDVNTGMPGISEADAMVNVLHQLQGVISCPVQIDTMDPTAMERALRMVNGKPLINSVNGKAESMSTVFPLAAKYGGVVVGLTLDEDGIPETAEGRYAIAEKIVRTAGEYGIKKNDIIIDPLCMAVSAGVPADVTLDAITLIKERLGVNTILGVSNISFGLPERENINAAFFSMALKAGLTAAIVNPLS
ncbi:MAG: homocysteine S-methyltransferase family protein, partial [Lachnospiraceae bacterium]|nr:homocysteine S-methyltransferase family protein [Lachnospiraceae bacterium]